MIKQFHAREGQLHYFPVTGVNLTDNTTSMLETIPRVLQSLKCFEGNTLVAFSVACFNPQLSNLNLAAA